MKIAILSRNSNLYSTKKLVESIHNNGHECLVIDPLKCNIIVDKKESGIYYNNVILNNIDAIIPRIGASITYYGAAVIRQFEKFNTYSIVSSQALLQSRDKFTSMQLLSSAGIDLPRTVFTNFSKDTSNIISQAGGVPIIIKLLEGTQGLGVILAENKKTATSIIDAFNGIKVRAMVQEFISESKGADLRVFVIGNKVVGAMKRQGNEDEFRSNLHRGGVATKIELTNAEELTAVLAAKTLGLDVAGVDILQSDRGPLVIEVNSSPGLEGIENTTDIDISDLIIKYIEEKFII